MDIEIILIGTVVVIALLGIVYLLGHREDKQQREYLRSQVEELCTPENQDFYHDGPVSDGSTLHQQRDLNGVAHRPESTRARTGDDEPVGVARHRSD